MFVEVILVAAYLQRFAAIRKACEAHGIRLEQEGCATVHSG